jgi:hypothetical protein
VGLAELRLTPRLPALALLAEAPATALGGGLCTLLAVALLKWQVVDGTVRGSPRCGARSSGAPS